MRRTSPSARIGSGVTLATLIITMVVTLWGCDRTAASKAQAVYTDPPVFERDASQLPLATNPLEARLVLAVLLLHELTLILDAIESPSEAADFARTIETNVTELAQLTQTFNAHPYSARLPAHSRYRTQLRNAYRDLKIAYRQHLAQPDTAAILQPLLTNLPHINGSAKTHPPHQARQP